MMMTMRTRRRAWLRGWVMTLALAACGALAQAQVTMEGQRFEAQVPLSANQ